ncbi:uncharacterized protein G2W53_015516 [Senna tora]|uniref:Uncharacterized protein n=1 Tax=Senna tora TaxID=362788 RepID=A0A834WV49_9FABA|nr:uncharacterized protein G2W53_015516 [Senna tora]
MAPNSPLGTTNWTNWPARATWLPTCPIHRTQRRIGSHMESLLFDLTAHWTVQITEKLYNIHSPASIIVFISGVIISGMLSVLMPFRIGLVIWPYDIHTPDIQPNTFMGGVVLGHYAWAIAGNKKEGSALDSPFGGRIGCSGGLNLPLFAKAYTFSIALTVAGWEGDKIEFSSALVKSVKSLGKGFSVSFSASTRAASSRGEELVGESTCPARLGGATPDRLSWEKVAPRALSDQMLVDITSLAFG